MRSSVRVTMEVNGEAVEATFAPYKTLLEVLREELGLTGTKHGCELLAQHLEQRLVGRERDLDGLAVHCHLHLDARAHLFGPQTIRTVL